MIEKSWRYASRGVLTREIETLASELAYCQGFLCHLCITTSRELRPTDSPTLAPYTSTHNLRFEDKGTRLDGLRLLWRTLRSTTRATRRPVYIRGISADTKLAIL
jgi:hypothetical protein